MPLSPSPARWLEWFVAACSLFLLTDALDRALHAMPAAATGPPLARAILIPFFAAALLLLARDGRAAVAAATRAWPVMLPVVLAAASCLWSTDPPVTVRWVAGLVGTTLVGVFLAVRFDIDEQLEVVCAALGAAVVASAVALLLWPEVGSRATGRGLVWLGVFEENNLFGRVMSLAALAFFVLALEQSGWAAGPGREMRSVVSAIGRTVGPVLESSQRRELYLVAAAGFALSAVLLLGSRSLTARLVTATCLIATWVVVGLRRQGRAARRRVVAGTALALLLGAAVLVQTGGRVVPLLGRDASLTGRTKVWNLTLTMARERLWFGHGYATFWPRAQAVPQPVSPHPDRWPLRHPHNGFLELLFELGLVGVVVFLVPFLFVLRRALALSVAGRARLWPLAYLLFLAFSNVAESGLLRHKIFWALYVAVAVDLCGGAYAATPAPQGAGCEAAGSSRTNSSA